jgi:hypothetical protein
MITTPPDTPLDAPEADNRQARQAASATGPEAPAATSAASVNRQARQATTESSDKRLTRADMAAELGLSMAALRRLAGRVGVPGQLVARAGGGDLVVFTDADVAALRQARQATGAATDNREEASGKRQAASAATESSDKRPPADEPAGWREALLRADEATRRETARADSLRSERDVALVREQAALRRAEEAERGMGAANTRLEALRAAWWHWRVLLDALGPVARLRRRWPDAPAELVADRLLARPEG